MHTTKEYQKSSFWIFSAICAPLTVAVWSVDLSPIVGNELWRSFLPIARWVMVVACVAASIIPLATRSKDLPVQLKIVALAIAFLIPSVALSDQPYYTFAQFARFASIAMLALSISTNEEATLRCAKWIYYTIATICFVSLTFHFALFESVKNFSLGQRIRMVGISNHPNTLAQLSSTGLIVSLAYIASGVKSRTPVHLHVAIAITAGVCLWASDSRAARMFTALSILASAGLYLTRTTRPSMAKFATWATVALTALIAQCLPLFLVLTDLGKQAASTTDAYGASNAERVAVWSRALDQFLLQPWQGQGFGIPLALGRYRWDGTEVGLGYAHNLLLNSVFSAGIGGILYFLLSFIALSGSLWIIISRKCASESGLMRISWVSASLFMFLTSSLDGALQGLWFTNLIFWLGLAVAAGAWGGRIEPNL